MPDRHSSRRQPSLSASVLCPTAPGVSGPRTFPPPRHLLRPFLLSRFPQPPAGPFLLFALVARSHSRSFSLSRSSTPTMRSFILAAFLAAFAGQVFAQLNITIPTLGVIHASQFLTVNDSVFTDCSSDCSPAITAIQQCGDNDLACLCNTTTTIVPIVKCQQCMFTDLVHLNRRPQDPRAGQTDAIAAYVSGCTLANRTVDTTLTKLQVPSDWNGPFGQGLTTFGTVVSVLAATVLGAGMITVVNTM
ncbi:hypothetical protein C8Q78DRAFT_1043171 [Trametes maxima]|nr:hypothetical protein C8Q78DRAFT_1043171 [Trametes maxima]